MINPKYNPSNYLKHQAIPIILDNQKINQLFGSSLLLVKWWAVADKILPKSDLTGIFRVHLSSPLGDLEPQDYQIKVSDRKKIYIQFLTIPQPDFQYKIEVIHPQGITRSHLEIWEYLDPSKPFTNTQLSPNMNYIGVSNSDPALLAATLANAAAIGTLAVSMTAQPGLIADAIANNAMNDENYPNTLVGASLMQLLAPDQTRQKVKITNWHTVDIKIWTSTSSLANTMTFLSDGAFITLEAAKIIGGVLKQGGVLELDSEECKSNIYAIANGSTGAKGVAITITRTAP